VQAGEVPYPLLPKITGNGNDDPPCQSGSVAMLFPIDLKSYDVPALRLVYDAFSEIMQRVPAFNNSLFLLEGYSVQGVQAVPAATTAFPHRSQKLLLYVFRSLTHLSNYRLLRQQFSGDLLPTKQFLGCSGRGIWSTCQEPSEGGLWKPRTTFICQLRTWRRKP
jgi:hypothetical protein